MSPNTPGIARALFGLVRDPVKLTIDLFKVMIPIIVVVRVLQQLGAIRYIALPLGPVMEVVGLPGEMGLVWATAMLNNLYGGIAVLLSLSETTPLTTAQMTVLCTMMLVAHTLPIELKIAQLSGPRLLFQAVCRLGSAMLLGWMLFAIYRHGQFLQVPAAILIAGRGGSPPNEQTWAEWALNQTQNLISIFIIILCIFLLMRLLEKIRVIELMNRMLRPLLRLLGIGHKASAVTVIGLTLGVTYGGGLIIREARSGKLKKEDVFYSLTLMGLSHALIEDTLLMIMVGGH
ncbi:MAG: hypothetical protein JRJ60_10580, partial [Deltaproteobacteria bacterium]|nr:hypothetical protein [Deltaproteobacteria bacterium]